MSPFAVRTQDTQPRNRSCWIPIFEVTKTTTYFLSPLECILYPLPHALIYKRSNEVVVCISTELTVSKEAYQRERVSSNWAQTESNFTLTQANSSVEGCCTVSLCTLPLALMPWQLYNTYSRQLYHFDTKSDF